MFISLIDDDDANLNKKQENTKSCAAFLDRETKEQMLF